MDNTNRMGQSIWFTTGRTTKLHRLVETEAIYLKRLKGEFTNFDIYLSLAILGYYYTIEARQKNKYMSKTVNSPFNVKVCLFCAVYYM